MSNLTKELELMLELDRLEKKIIVLRDQFKDYPIRKSELNNEIFELKRSLSSEQEHYEEQRLEISFLKDELNELNIKISGIKEALEDKYDEELTILLDEKQKLQKVKEEELKSSETLLLDTVEVVNESENHYREVKEKNTKEIKRITEEKESFEEEVDKLNEDKKNIFEQLSEIDLKEDLNSLYNRISEAFPGGVVAKIENESCSRCFIEVTPQLLNELYREAVPKYREGEIITCPSCGCIIYIDPNEITEE